MKKIFLFLAITSVAFFSSCKEDDTEPTNNTSTPQTASIINMDSLKSFVGQTHAQICSSITSKGYTLTSTEEDPSGAKNYIYSSAQTATGGKQCIIGEYNNVIYTAAYAEAGTSRTALLTNFTTFSNNAYSVFGNLSYDYMGTIKFGYDIFDYDSHQSFANAYNSSSNFDACNEMYSSNPDELTEFDQAAIMFQQASMKTTICALTAMYVDYLLSPGFVNKKNINDIVRYRE